MRKTQRKKLSYSVVDTVVGSPDLPSLKDLVSQQLGVLAAPDSAGSPFRIYLSFGKLPPQGGPYPITDQSTVQRLVILALLGITLKGHYSSSASCGFG